MCSRRGKAPKEKFESAHFASLNQRQKVKVKESETYKGNEAKGKNF